jgi:DNA-binding NarL/FixJ family response regulator
LLLREQEDFRVIAEATGGVEAVRLVRALHPDILLVDFLMSDLRGLDVVVTPRAWVTTGRTASAMPRAGYAPSYAVHVCGRSPRR